MLRKAFDEVVVDPAFKEAAARARLPLVPMSGVEVEAFIRQMMSISPAAVQRASQALSFGAKDNEQLKSLDATIASVDDNRLDVKTGDGNVTQLKIRSEGSMIIVHGNQAEPAALKTGMDCSFRYDGETQLVQTVSCK